MDRNPASDDAPRTRLRAGRPAHPTRAERDARRLVALVLVSIVLIALAAAGAPAAGARAQDAAPTASAPLPEVPDAAVRERLLASVVSLTPLEPGSGKPLPWGGGSGTVVSAGGLILTNYHVVSPADGADPHPWHAVLPTDPQRTDRVPPFRYRARYVAGRPEVDLALLEIAAAADGSPLPAGTRFPFAEIGDPEALRPGDPLFVVGYPSVSGATVTVTTGVMSGWLGEDYVGSGRAWIKTDAKISYGNSGGGAFDLAGRLVGVPTEFYTLPYDDGFTDLQSYLRPVSLAYPLLADRLPALVATGRVDPGVPLPEPVGEPSDDYGMLADGATVERTLPTPAWFGDVSYHSYRIDVPEGASALSVTVRGEGGADADLAVRYGGPITDYGEVDFLDTSEGPDVAFRRRLPSSGSYYLDVMNMGTAPVPYRLSATVTNGGNDRPLAVPWNGSGFAGALAPGQRAEGALESTPGGGSYHTFTVWVPPGTATIQFGLEADGDLDLAIKPGSEIASYADDGDWLQSDFATASSAKLSVRAPQPGMWFVDVINLIDSDAPIAYTLIVR